MKLPRRRIGDVGQQEDHPVNVATAAIMVIKESGDVSASKLMVSEHADERCSPGSRSPVDGRGRRSLR